MSWNFQPDQELENFSGAVPIFPLPNVVFFPHTLLPLHIFEARYRKMVEDAGMGDGLIAMALLKPGYEDQYHTKTSPVFDSVCIGRISAEEQLADGTYHLALQGLSRATILEEDVDDLPYRVAQLELQKDHYPRDPTIDRKNRQRELISGFREMLPALEVDNVFHYTLDAEIPLGGLCDILSHAMHLESEKALEILDEANVDLRSDLVLTELRKLARKVGQNSLFREFPPPFSNN